MPWCLEPALYIQGRRCQVNKELQRVDGKRGRFINAREMC